MSRHLLGLSFRWVEPYIPQHVEKSDAAARLDIIALKAHVTQLAVNTFLLTIDIDGVVRSDTVSCTTCKKDWHTSDRCWFCAETKLRDDMNHVAETKRNLKKLRDAEMILKTKKTATVEKRVLLAAQQNSYDAGDELLTAAFVGNMMMMMWCLFKGFKESKEKEALLSPCIGSIKT